MTLPSSALDYAKIASPRILIDDIHRNHPGEFHGDMRGTTGVLISALSTGNFRIHKFPITGLRGMGDCGVQEQILDIPRELIWDITKAMNSLVDERFKGLLEENIRLRESLRSLDNTCCTPKQPC